MEKVERVLVQGVVQLTIPPDCLMALVPVELAKNKDALKAWFEMHALEMIDKASIQVECVHEFKVEVSCDFAHYLVLKQGVFLQIAMVKSVLFCK